MNCRPVLLVFVWYEFSVTLLAGSTLVRLYHGTLVASTALNTRLR